MTEVKLIRRLRSADLSKCVKEIEKFTVYLDEIGELDKDLYFCMKRLRHIMSVLDYFSLKNVAVSDDIVEGVVVELIKIYNTLVNYWEKEKISLSHVVDLSLSFAGLYSLMYILQGEGV